jgi:hypothetical protein
MACLGVTFNFSLDLSSPCQVLIIPRTAPKTAMERVSGFYETAGKSQGFPSLAGFFVSLVYSFISALLSAL